MTAKAEGEVLVTFDLAFLEKSFRLEVIRIIPDLLIPVNEIESCIDLVSPLDLHFPVDDHRFRSGARHQPYRWSHSN